MAPCAAASRAWSRFWSWPQHASEKKNDAKRGRKMRLTRLLGEPPAASNCGWTAIVFRSQPVLCEEVCHERGHGQTPRRVASRSPSPPHSVGALSSCPAADSQSADAPASDVPEDRTNFRPEGTP